jgi:hypothetical protein
MLGERSAATATERASLRSLLSVLARGQQRYPGRQLDLHVQDPLARPDQLLGHHVAQPARALHRPHPLPIRRRPNQQPPDLAGAGAHSQLAQFGLGVVDRHRSVRPLMRVNPDHHGHQHPLGYQPDGQPRQARLISDRSALAPLSSHTTARPSRAGTSFASQTTNGPQTGQEPNPPGPPNATRHPQRLGGLSTRRDRADPPGAGDRRS